MPVISILARIIWSRGRPVELLLDVHYILLDVQQDSSGCPLEFCKFASNVLELLVSLKNTITISTGHPVDSRGCPIKILLDVLRKFLLHFWMKLAILRHLKQICKILVDVQQNPIGHPVESSGRPIEVLQDVLQIR